MSSKHCASWSWTVFAIQITCPMMEATWRFVTTMPEVVSQDMHNRSYALVSLPTFLTELHTTPSPQYRSPKKVKSRAFSVAACSSNLSSSGKASRSLRVAPTRSQRATNVRHAIRKCSSSSLAIPTLSIMVTTSTLFMRLMGSSMAHVAVCATCAAKELPIASRVRANVSWSSLFHSTGDETRMTWLLCTLGSRKKWSYHARKSNSQNRRLPASFWRLTRRGWYDMEGSCCLSISLLNRVSKTGRSRFLFSWKTVNPLTALRMGSVLGHGTILSASKSCWIWPWEKRESGTCCLTRGGMSFTP
eukprot:PhM_4_TR16769/c0_g3_i1/m.75224